MGVGTILGSNVSGVSGNKSFSGKIYPKEIDTWYTANSKDGNSLYCNLKSGQKIVFKEGDYFRITPEDGVGFWVKGVAVNGKMIKQFSDLVDLNDVENFEILKPDGVKTTLLIVATLAVVIGILGAAYDFDPGGFWGNGSITK